MLGLEGNTKKDFMGSYEKDWHVTKTPFNIIWGGRNERYNNIPYGQEERIIDKPKIDKYKIVLGSQLKIENNIRSTLHSTRIFHCSCTNFYTFMIQSLLLSKILSYQQYYCYTYIQYTHDCAFKLLYTFYHPRTPSKAFYQGQCQSISS